MTFKPSIVNNVILNVSYFKQINYIKITCNEYTLFV